jgi:hypothetical protein
LTKAVETRVFADCWVGRVERRRGAIVGGEQRGGEDFFSLEEDLVDLETTVDQLRSGTLLAPWMGGQEEAGFQGATNSNSGIRAWGNWMGAEQMSGEKANPSKWSVPLRTNTGLELTG